MPVAISLAWGIWPAPPAAADGSDCANPASPVAAWRLAEAVVVLAALAVLATVLHASRTSLLLRRPARQVVRWSIVAFLVAGPLALVLGPILARPFFGDVGYDADDRRGDRPGAPVRGRQRDDGGARLSRRAARLVGAR